MSASTPVTVFRRELITCRTDIVPHVLAWPGGGELLIPDVVVLGTPSQDEYGAMLDDGNVAGDKGQLGVMVTQAAGVLGTIAASCEPELVKILTVLGGLFPCVSTNRDLQQRLGVLSPAPLRFAPSGLVSGPVSLPRCDI